MGFPEILTAVADTLCGYPLFFTLIGGGLLLFFSSGMVSLRRLPHAIAALRAGKSSDKGAISSAQALASVVAATVGMGNIAGVAIAIAMGGPGAIFWMWVSALVGMCTKYHEGVLAIKYRSSNARGYAGGPMHIITRGLGERWRWLAVSFAVAGLFGTLCIMNANQLTEALSATAVSAGATLGEQWIKFIIGLTIAGIVSAVVLGGIKRIAAVATVLVPFMVGAYFIMVLYIIMTHLDSLPVAVSSIFANAFNLEAGWGALAGVAIIGARRAALVNDAGVGTASIMHSTSANREPVREGLVAMLGPAIDSGFVCTLTAIAILLGTDIPAGETRGLTLALNAFGSSIPAGGALLTAIVTCFALSSMFTYSFYGTSCAVYLFGEKRARYYTYAYIASLVVFAVVPLGVAVALCDLFYALMAFPTMFAVLALRHKVKEETDRYFGVKTVASPVASCE